MPEPDLQSEIILDTLERTLTINQLWVQGKGWESNNARAELQKDNFLRYWRVEKQRQAETKVMAKFGGSHMVRGLSQTAVHDLGTLLPELAALDGGHSVSVLVLPGIESLVAAINPTTWDYEPRPAKDGYANGLEPLLNATYEDKFTLFDLRPIRSVVGTRRGDLGDELFRIVHGFDMLLVMTGSTPAGDLDQD